MPSLTRRFSSFTHSVQEFFSEEPEEKPLPETLATAVQHPNALLEHLDALRKHLFRSVFYLFVATGISLFFNRQILVFLSRPLPNGFSSMVAIDPTEPVGTVMKVSLLSGFALSLPLIVLELYFFVAPGLSRRARFAGLLAIPIVVLFFLGGMSFAFFVMLKPALAFLLTAMGIPTQVRPSSYMGFVTGLMFWVGVAFEFPLVIFLLASLGLVRARALAQQWRLAVVVIAIIAALITPTVDPVNMALIMGPLILLYFLSILLASLAQRGRESRAGPA